MSKILLVDDDPVVVDIYLKKLVEAGFEVDTAADGLLAVRAMQKSRPDLMVLDLMMPRFSGFEVLKFVRSQAGLKDLRVVVLSNFYVGGDQQGEVTALADAAMLKSACRPAALIETLKRILAQPPRSAATADISKSASKPVAPPEATSATVPSAPHPHEAEELGKNRRDFLKNGPATMAMLRKLNQVFVVSDSPHAQDARLLDFYRKAHFVTAMAGLAGLETIAMLSSAFESLLFQLHEKPSRINRATHQTIAHALEILSLLFAEGENARPFFQTSCKALVVDDDPLSTRVAAGALLSAHALTTTAGNGASALEALAREQYDLILLDVQLPDMNGQELSRRVRAFPQYQFTPIIFVTGDAQFEQWLGSGLGEGNDLIIKPVFPIELAVKALTHLLKRHLSSGTRLPV
jgi:CheY-like chemotaxis protein